MLNPDRAEFESKPPSIFENPKKNGHIPRWLRVPTFAARMFLITLTTTPGMAVAANVTNYIENSSIVYDSGKNIAMNSQYDFDPLLIPAPTAIAQHSAVYKLYLAPWARVYRDFQDPSKFIGDYGRTNISLKAGQTLEISATGKVTCCPFVYCGDDPYRWARTCKDAPVFKPDGYHVWRDGTTCPGDAKLLVGDMGTGGPFGGYGTGPKISIGSYWKGSVDRNGFLWLNLDESYGGSKGPDCRWGGGGFDITVTVTDPPPPTPTSVPSSRPAFTPEPIRSTTPAEKGPDLFSWLLGIGATFLTGLGSYWGYERWRRGRIPLAPGLGGTSGGTGPGVNIPPGIGMGIAGVLGGGPNPSRGPNARPTVAGSNPSTAPSTGPAQQKDPEWITGQQDFERRWQAAKSKFSPVRPGESSNKYEYVLERFKAAMDIVHEMSLDNSAISVPKMAVRIRAGMESVIPQIWPDNKILRRFFDPRFNAGYISPEDLAKIVYLPESYRTLSKFSRTQRNDVRRIRRIIVYVLHPDIAKNETDPKVRDSVDDLLKRFNPAWLYIENLIKQTP